MTNSTNPQVISQQAPIAGPASVSEPRGGARRGGLRRSVAGLVAAATIAFGGTTLLSVQEAQAAGVRPTTYGVTTGHRHAAPRDTMVVLGDQPTVRSGSVRKQI